VVWKLSITGFFIEEGGVDLLSITIEELKIGGVLNKV